MSICISSISYTPGPHSSVVDTMAEDSTLSTSGLCRMPPDFPYHACHDFWFSDGNVILCAGNFAFKVHRGQLERHADIFQTMLSIPQPDDAGGLYMMDCRIKVLRPIRSKPADHCPHAHYSYFRRPFVQDFPFLASVLRMSCKYFICVTRKQCLERLQIYFPTTLSEWDQRERMLFTPEGLYEPCYEIPSPIHVINLARELNVGSVLPAAFYDLARYGTSRTAAGTEPLAHVVLEAASSENTSSPRTAGRTPRLSPMLLQDATPVMLSHDDLVLTFHGREVMQRSVATFLDAQVMNRSPAEGCLGGQTCRDAFYYITLHTLRTVGGIDAGRDGDPLYTLGQMINMVHHAEWVDGQYLRGLPMCGRCREEFILAVYAGRQAVWDQIPEWFGLEPYDTLNERDAELNERDMYP